MSDINLDFTVSNNSINFTVEPNDITITPTDIQLTVSTGGLATPAAPVNSVQYNKDSEFAGDSSFAYIEGTQTLGVQNLVLNGTAYINNANRLNVDVANLKITGGTNGYVLQTDGTGNLDWTAQTGGGGNGTPGGSNTQIQYNDNGAFGGNSGFTFNEVSGNVAIPGSLSTTGNLTVTGNIIGTVANANYASYANISNIANTANSVAGANVTGQVNYASIANSVAIANVVGIGNIATVNLTGSTSNVLYGNGVFGAIGNVASANFANYAGNVTVAAQPNITSLGVLTDLRTVGDNVHLGYNAGAQRQAISAIALGKDAGLTDQRTGAIAIGDTAGQNLQGNFSIAIGYKAAGNASAPQPNNSIIINATGANLNGPFANSFVVKPIRSAVTANILYYDNASGEITYEAGGNSTTNPAGSNTQIQFNNSNIFGASTNFTFNSTTNLLTVAGNITATGNVNAGTLSTTGTMSATGTITGGNISTSGVVTATGNITGGNIRTVNGYVESQNGNVYANNGYVIGGEGVFSGLRFVNTISANVTVSPIGVSTASHKIPISINGTTYYILLTT